MVGLVRFRAGTTPHGVGGAETRQAGDILLQYMVKREVWLLARAPN